MKNIFFFKKAIRVALLAPALTGALLLTSCDKDVTDLIPVDRITETAAFDTPQRVELSVAGVYDAAQSGFYAGNVIRGYPFGAAHVEQGDTRGEDMLNLQAFYQITYESGYNPTTANNQYMWETLYALVNRANVVIEGLQGAVAKGVITADKAKEYEGEAKFLRALAHHELITHFARPYNHTGDASHLGVPYRTLAINSTSRLEEIKAQGRNTVKEVYDKILEDLNFAENNLPADRASNQLTRATKGAAIAIKTRVNLHKRDWAAVVTEGGKLVSGTLGSYTSPVGGYALTATPEGPFASNKNNKESIFSIENSTVDNPGTNGALPQMYGASPARGLVAISPIIWNASFWPADDLRRTQLATKASTGYYFTNKYRDLTTWSDNAPIIRYAEVLLNMAEAQARTGNEVEALAKLNAVRGRSTSSLVVAAGDPLVQAIINERRIEFLSEGLRWKDIHRLAKEGKFGPAGIPAKVAASKASKDDFTAASGSVREAAIGVVAIGYDDHRFLWPIPLSEVTTNPTLAAQQNPGY